jgi:hypothetical protein
MDGDDREFHSFRACCCLDNRAILRTWVRLTDWRKCKRKRKRYGYEYDVLIFHHFIFLSLFWPSLTSRH